MKRLVPWLAALAVLIGARTARSTTIIPPTFDELVDSADTIFVGTAIDRHTEWEVRRDGRAIVTWVTFDVERVLKGSLGLRTQLRFLGGTIGDLRLEVADMPEFHIGDRDMLFLETERRAISPLVGMAYGRLRIMRDPSRGLDEIRTHDGAPIGAVEALGTRLTPSLQAPRSMAYRDFESAVRQRVAARRGR